MSKYTRFFAILTALAIVCFAGSAMAATKFVDPSKTGGTQDGNSWTNAYLHIADAATSASAGDDILIKTGLYDIAPGAGLDYPSSEPIRVTNNMNFYGGCAGTESGPGDRASAATRSTVAHVNLVLGTATERETGTGYTKGGFVLSTGTTVVFDQIAVTSCTAVDSDFSTAGWYSYPGSATSAFGIGAIHARRNVNLTLTNCDVTDNLNSCNQQSWCGGSVTMERGATLAMTGCAVTNNRPRSLVSGAAASGAGGAILVQGEATIDNCVISGNIMRGGRTGPAALWIVPPTNGATITNTLFSGNTCTQKWGPIILSFDTTTTLYTVTNCTFTNNLSCDGVINLFNRYDGGAPAGGTTDGWGPGRLVMSACTFSNNYTLTSFAGAIRKFGNVQWTTAPVSTIANCTFNNNVAKLKGGAIAWKEMNSLEVSNCDFIANTSAQDGAAIFNEGSAKTYAGMFPTDRATFTYTNCLFKNNVSTTTLGGVVVTSGNGPVTGYPLTKVVNCTFIGNNTQAGGVIKQLADANGNLQIVNCVIAGNSTNAVESIRNETGTGRAANTFVDSVVAASVGGGAVAGITQSNLTTGTSYASLVTGAITNGASQVLDLGLGTDGIVTIPSLDKNGSARVDIPGRGFSSTDAGAFEYTSPLAAGYSRSETGIPFGTRAWQSGAITGTVTISNPADATAVLSYTTGLSGDAGHQAEFVVTHDSGGTSPLAPGESEVLLVTWTPGVDSGARSVSLDITHGSVDSLALGGTSTSNVGQLDTTPSTTTALFDGFNWNDNGGTTFTLITVTNNAGATGNLTYTISKVASTYSGEFTITREGGTGVSPLAPGESEQWRVTWTPVHTANGTPRNVDIEIVHDAVNHATPYVFSTGGTPVPVEVSVFRVE